MTVTGDAPGRIYACARGQEADMKDNSTHGGKAEASLRAARDKNAFAALGRAVSYLMTKPAFANARFGHWARTLTGQINRNHYFFVQRGERTVGFLGWALVDEGKARLWVEGKADIGSEDCLSGDCIVINAWAADDNAVSRFVLSELRRVALGRKTAYAKRFYSDGRTRPVVININEFVDSHVAARAREASPTI